MKAVECDDEGAKSKVVKEVEKSADCEVASVSAPSEDKVYCTEPYPPGSVPTKLGVGVCTTYDPKRPASADIRLVSCGDREAKSKVTERVRREDECRQGSLRGSKGEVFCVVPA